jgi:predicted transcriptional regulator
MKGKPRGVLIAGNSALPSTAVKLSVNVSADVGARLRRFAFDERLSESSIVEIALHQLFTRNPSEAALARFLREHGASLRRTNNTKH